MKKIKMESLLIIGCAFALLAVAACKDRPTGGAGQSASITEEKQMATHKPVDWRHFTKPDDKTLREMLTSEQYNVTQKDGTEPPFKNEYDNNHREGIYVDIVSG
jgi:hypothetical protein